MAGFAPAGNAKALVALGFDGTKIDGCGPDRNVTEFAALVDAAAAAAATAGAAAKPITIEDCNGTVHYSSPHTHFQLSYSLSIFIPKSQTLQHPLHNLVNNRAQSIADDPDWDRGSHDVSSYHDTGCSVSGAGYYR